jgi:hypothetical protein
MIVSVNDKLRYAAASSAETAQPRKLELKEEPARISVQ